MMQYIYWMCRDLNKLILLKTLLMNLVKIKNNISQYKFIYPEYIIQ